MEEKKQVSLSELRVGIFVILGAGVLAFAVFQIGSTAGLFMETFHARTYLNNVSGLKPGDIVLLGGVEIGNVTGVRITPADRMPETAANILAQARIGDLEDQDSILAADLANLDQRINDLRTHYQSVTIEQGSASEQARVLRAQLDDFEDLRSQAVRDLERVRERAQRARDDLQNIVVRMEIQTGYRDWIRSDSYISLGSVGLLGDKYIQISLGRASDPPRSVPGAIPGRWWGEEEVEFVEITGRPQTGFEELITGANDILVNFRTLSEKVQDIVSRFESGEGTVGKFLTDPSFYNNLNDTVLAAKGTMDDASRVLQDFSGGDGTISRLIHEPDLYERISGSAARLDRVLADLEAGEGTVGKLLKDPELYDNAREMMASIRSVASRLESGEGTLGKLSTDDKLYREMNAALEKVSTFVNSIEEGKGTLGRLAKDEQLYENINQLSAEMVKLIYDFRQNPKRFLTVKFELF